MDTFDDSRRQSAISNNKYVRCSEGNISEGDEDAVENENFNEANDLGPKLKMSAQMTIRKNSMNKYLLLLSVKIVQLKRASPSSIPKVQ